MVEMVGGKMKIRTLICLIFVSEWIVSCAPSFEAGNTDSSSTLNESFNDPSQGKSIFSCDSNLPKTLSMPARRLTRKEIENVLSDIFGADILSRVSSAMEGLPEDDLGESGLSDFDFTEGHVKALTYLTYKVGREVSADPTVIKKFTPACNSLMAPNEACVTDFIRRLGYLTLRRPVDETQELTDFVAKFRAAGNPTAGFAAVVEGMVMNPSFLFLIPVGEGSDPLGTRLNQYVMASKISFATVRSLPDAALFADASKGQLNDPTKVKEHVLRLLTSVRGKERFMNLFASWLNLDGLMDPEGDPKFLKGIDVKGLREEMLVELKDLIYYTVFSTNGNLKDLLSSKRTFARTANLAGLLETKVWTPGQEPPLTTSTWRKGLLLRPSFFVSGAEESRPIMRGVFFIRNILGYKLENPSAEDLNDPARSAVNNDVSTRDRVAAMTGAGRCLGCHGKINPIGFAFENLDGLGRQRFEEEVYVDGEVYARYPINSSATGLMIDDRGPQSAANASDLIALLATSSRPAAAFAMNVFRGFWYRMENLKDNGDSCLLRRMQQPMITNAGTFLEVVAEGLAQDVLAHKK